MIEKNNSWEPQNIPLNVIYEDKEILVINKTRGLVVHPGSGNRDKTILNALLYHYPDLVNVPRAGIVHRLDKDTTGLMVVAKTFLAQTQLIKSLQLREITREYEAIVVFRMTTGGVIDKPIARDPIKRTCMAIHPMGKHAITHYRIIEHFRDHTHLRVRLETGRTHQIRVHMAHIHHPLIGDSLYNKRSCSFKGVSDACFKIIDKFDRPALHATMLRLYHPISGIQMKWNATLPNDMIELISALKADFQLHKNN